ncbi:MAG: hypothetical protein OHK0039_39210 [Bacteroidia bacterium]
MGLGGLQAQYSVLFVDDSKDAFGNAELVASALDSLGITYTYFNAPDSAESPLDTYMAQFDLVIRHTSTDGVATWFWNGLDEDNARLKAYLDGGGSLWVIGHDFFFDRYGPAPYTFAPGDFAYDYLGITTYAKQSFGDDGSLGLPIAVPDTAQPIAGLDTLGWAFPTLYWADAVVPRSEAVPVMRMGDSTYVLADSVCGLWYARDNFQVLSFLFDLSLASDFAAIKGTVGSVVAFFEAQSSTRIEAAQLLAGPVRVYPNPGSGAGHLTFALREAAVCEASLWDLQGRQVALLMRPALLPAGDHAIDWQTAGLPAGMYLLRLGVGDQLLARPYVIVR